MAPDPRIKNVGQNSFEVTFNNFGEKKLTYEIVETEVGWRISDMSSCRYQKLRSAGGSVRNV
jgi:hypothetical protein